MNNLQNQQYDPNSLIDALITRLGLKNDAALARAMEWDSPVVSKIRSGKIVIGRYSALLLRMHEVSGIAFSELWALMAAPVMHVPV